jgi:HPt (histidine-containing phosphotransfer) domain-containing protein
MSDWRDKPEIETQTISTLVNAVGVSVFRDMSKQFVADLVSLAARYRQARERGDEADARANAHALKGAASNIGLLRLAALASRLEAGETGEAVHLDAELETALARLDEAV